MISVTRVSVRGFGIYGSYLSDLFYFHHGPEDLSSGHSSYQTKHVDDPRLPPTW